MSVQGRGWILLIIRFISEGVTKTIHLSGIVGYLKARVQASRGFICYLVILYHMGYRSLAAYHGFT